MKTFRTFLFAAAVAAPLACTEKSMEPSSGHETGLITFSATVTEPETRTILDADGLSVLWESGDAIAVSGAESPFIADIPDGTSGSSAEFTGNVAAADNYYAVYPASACGSFSGSNAVIDLKKEQSAVKNTFDSEAGILTAMTGAEEMSFAFRHVVGYVKFTVDENSGDIVSVSVKASGGERLSGTFTVDCAAETPDLAVTAGSSTVSLVSDEPMEAGNYYIAMLPGTYSQGLEFTFTDAQGRTATKVLDGEISLEAGVVQNIGTVACLDGISTDIDESVIWEGETAMGNWEGYCQDLAWGEFDWSSIDLSQGPAYLVAEIVEDPSSTWWQFQMSSATKWEDLSEPVFIELLPGQTEVTVELTESRLQELQDKDGLIIRGSNYTLKKVTLRQETVYTSEHEVWSGIHDLGTDWSSFLALTWDANVFQNIPDGSVLHIEYDTYTDQTYWQLKLMSGNDGWPVLTSIEYADPEAGTVMLAKGPNEFSCLLNDTDAGALRTYGLVVGGQYATITRIYWTE